MNVPTIRASMANKTIDNERHHGIGHHACEGIETYGGPTGWTPWSGAQRSTSKNHRMVSRTCNWRVLDIY